MPYIPYTDEQKQLANSVDLPTFLRMRGETLVPVGREFKLVYHDGYGKHDSITISGSQWYDHKNQIGGGPIKFMREHYGMNFQEAMQALLGHSALPLTHEVQPVMAKEKKEFRLPEANDNMHRVYAYLIKQRFIAPEVITHFAKRKLLYEDKKHHNAVFVGVDSSGVPRQAHKRSTTTFGNSFRQTIEGSDTKYSFAHFGKNNMLFVFEAPIDMLSFITLYQKNWQDSSYIAMNGVYESAVLTALEEHPNIDWVVICTDNDEGGIDAADRLWDILSERGYDNLTIYPPNNKDWNEDLKEEHGVPFLPAVLHKRLEEYRIQAESLQYYPCRIEKLRSQLNAAFQNGQYRYLAEYALAGSVFFSQKTASNQDCDRAFSLSKQRLGMLYHPYHDRCKSTVLYRDLSAKIADVMQDLKNYARTEDQTRAIADKLYDLADYAGEVRAQIVLALAISNAAMTKKYCSASVSHSDNMRYSFRVWLLNLGLIGDEYKNCRTHLLKHLTGDIAWRHPEDGVAQRERLRQQRIATRSQVERASVDMPNDGMPAREQEQRNEPPCDERVGHLSIQGRHTFGFEQHPVSASGDPVSEVREEVGETPDENLEATVSDCDDFEETEDEGMAMSM